ncbi:MAG: hypothetical protein S4CHLAM20_06500 [Chlamydiia bacterium]|nr:hypothetical protein [Chlamydiia bacterium]
MKRYLTFIAMSLLMVSCNYKSSSLCLNGQDVIETSIPVIKKDPNGYLRNYLAREMSYSNSLYYKDRRAKYNLLVSITEDRNSKITFMWDRDPVTGRDLKVFYPSEGMREVVAKVELVDAATGEKVIEPFFLNESVDYDFVNPTVRSAVEFPSTTGTQSVLQFSLGQLDSEEGAQDASYNPVYEKLAKKIVTRLARTRFNKQT